MDNNQKQVWENIAEEWHEFKKFPAESTMEFLKKQKGKVLDFGSGSGRHLIKIKSGKMYLLDFSENMIELAKKKAKEEKIDAEFTVSSMVKTPYENNFFDAAICISALHCLNKLEQKKAVKELYRILKPKSQIFVGVWNKESKRLKRHKGKETLIKWNDKGERYYYLFDEKEIHDLFEKQGFKIISTSNSEMMIRFVAEKDL
ncbi:class I SAM-dependent methyltransferase [Candidatus Pacearchaeota archaeon]|jgi:ubiquinone/menaquinone biosynthesis C-methylase UbiE|nr:class I SAM-dependent methyltransferase [Candidatus Pacearchaeota archaeon]